MKHNIITLIICILSVWVVGSVSGIATVSSLSDWYTTIKKPSFNPPNWIFGPVWTILYIMLGVSLYYVFMQPDSDLRKQGLIIFGIQLFLNFLWSFLFFYFKSPGWAFIEIVFLWLFIVSTIYIFYKVYPLAGLLLIPYLLWVSFATLLNGTIWYLNR